jgi:hypothetical protein
VDFDMMLAGELLDNLLEPDEAGDAQFQSFSLPGVADRTIPTPARALR